MEQNVPAEHETTEVQIPDSTLLPIDSVAGYPAFLAEDSAHDGVVLGGQLDTLGVLRSLERFTPAHREGLVDAIIGDLAAWGAPQSALDTARVLQRPNAYAVVTGQQAGIAGGPLYTVYKAVGTVAAARRLAELHPGHEFVPVFWIEADDHDFDEVRSLTLLDRSGAVTTVGYNDNDARQLHVGDRVINPEGLAALIEQVREALPTSEYGEAAVQLLQQAYGDEHAHTLADGFARFLYALLGDTPLVLVSSRNPGLKRLAADVFQQEVSQPDRLFAALEVATQRLAADGLPTPIVPRHGALFVTEQGERRSLDADVDGYVVRGTSQRYSADELVALSLTEPERFSPKVALRPIVQDAILPTAIYLGGPSEVAYLRQVRDAYALFGQQAPALAPRPFVLLVEPRIRRAIETAGLRLEQLIVEEFDAATHFVDDAAEQRIESARAVAVDLVTQAAAAMSGVVESTDPTLTKSLGAAQANAVKAFDDLAKRLSAALRRRQGTEIERLNGARTALMPAGVPQERKLNALWAVGRVGLQRFRSAIQAIDIHNGVVQAIDL